MRKLLIAVSLLVVVSARAELLPLLDKLDIQIGPGIAVVDLDPFTTEEVLLGTVKVFEYQRIEIRLGGLVDAEREALVLGFSRGFNDLLTRLDLGERKISLPTLGIWCSGDLVSNEDGEKKIDFLWGVMAVLAEF